MKIKGKIVEDFIKDIGKEIDKRLFDNSSNNKEELKEVKNLCYWMVLSGMESSESIILAMFKNILNSNNEDSDKIDFLKKICDKGCHINKKNIEIK